MAGLAHSISSSAARRRTVSVSALREGAWLTPARLRGYPRIIGGALALGIAALVATSHAGFDLWHRPLGTDFVGVWVAGREVYAGHPAQPYDNAAHAAAQAVAFGASDSFLPWPYPPYALAVAAALGKLPYLGALALWQGATLALYLLATIRCARGAGLPRADLAIAALAFPAVAINLLHGQNGALSAALLAFGVLALPRRPAVGGVLLAVLAYKPQLALAVPVALAAGRHWRALAAAGATLAAMTAATLLAYGVAPWHAFLHNLGFARTVILEAGGLETFKLSSAFGAARLLGVPVPGAYAVQVVATLAAFAWLAWLWRGDVDLRLKLAGLALASLIATPYTIDYDTVLLGPALAALVSHFVRAGFPPYAKTLLAAAWAGPLVARTAAHLFHVPMGFGLAVALFVLVLVAARWTQDGAGSHDGLRPKAVPDA